MLSLCAAATRTGISVPNREVLFAKSTFDGTLDAPASPPRQEFKSRKFSNNPFLTVSQNYLTGVVSAELVLHIEHIEKMDDPSDAFTWTVILALCCVIIPGAVEFLRQLRLRRRRRNGENGREGRTSDPFNVRTATLVRRSVFAVFFLCFVAALGRSIAGEKGNVTGVVAVLLGSVFVAPACFLSAEVLALLVMRVQRSESLGRVLWFLNQKGQNLGIQNEDRRQIQVGPRGVFALDGSANEGSSASDGGEVDDDENVTFYAAPFTATAEMGVIVLEFGQAAVWLEKFRVDAYSTAFLIATASVLLFFLPGAIVARRPGAAAHWFQAVSSVVGVLVTLAACMVLFFVQDGPWIEGEGLSAAALPSFLAASPSFLEVQLGQDGALPADTVTFLWITLGVSICCFLVCCCFPCCFFLIRKLRTDGEAREHRRHAVLAKGDPRSSDATDSQPLLSSVEAPSSGSSDVDTSALGQEVNHVLALMAFCTFVIMFLLALAGLILLVVAKHSSTGVWLLFWIRVILTLPVLLLILEVITVGLSKLVRYSASKNPRTCYVRLRGSCAFLNFAVVEGEWPKTKLHVKETPFFTVAATFGNAVLGILHLKLEESIEPKQIGSLFFFTCCSLVLYLPLLASGSGKTAGKFKLFFGTCMLGTALILAAVFAGNAEQLTRIALEGEDSA
jgi:hypothetical protein